MPEASFALTETVKEVSLWKEYLVHATLFGIADQVRKDLKQIWVIIQVLTR